MYHLAKGQFCGPGNSALGKYITQTIFSKLKIANIQFFLNWNSSKSATEITCNLHANLNYKIINKKFETLYKVTYSHNPLTVSHMSEM